MNYQDAKRMQSALDDKASQCSQALQLFPKGNMGLTPDHVKQSPEWKLARANYARAHDQLRKFNAQFVKHFRAEIAADRRAKVQS